MTITATLIASGALVAGAFIPALQVPAVAFSVALLWRYMELPGAGKKEARPALAVPEPGTTSADYPAPLWETWAGSVSASPETARP